MSHLQPNMFSVIILSVIILSHFLNDYPLQGIAQSQEFGTMTLAIAIFSITTLGVTIENVTLNIMTLAFESYLC